MLIFAFEAAFTQNKNEFFYISAKNGLRLRTEPGMESKTITTISYDEQVTVIEKLNTPSVIDKKEGYWTKVKYSKHEGWVFGAYLRKDSESDFLNFVADYLNKEHTIILSDNLKEYSENEKLYDDLQYKKFLNFHKAITNLSSSDIIIHDFSDNIYIIEAPTYDDLLPLEPNKKFYIFYLNHKNWTLIKGHISEARIYDLNNDNNPEVISIDIVSNSCYIEVFEKINLEYLKKSDLALLGYCEFSIDKKGLFKVLNTSIPDSETDIIYTFSVTEGKFIKVKEIHK